MHRPAKKRTFRRRKEDPQARCRLLTDAGNNQMKLGNEQKAVLIYSKVSIKDFLYHSFNNVTTCQTNEEKRALRTRSRAQKKTTWMNAARKFVHTLICEHINGLGTLSHTANKCSNTFPINVFCICAWTDFIWFL